ncbi:MAG TPA: TIGR03619 family F420-dependent LLM class oxidoreductase [Chloroflexota bacterium]|nr:TIGR03619 family F420-dependent LLM class oxidoreductase [Chloroflexota bacterium]
MSVKVGIQLNAINNPIDSGERFWGVVDACERLGFDSLWLSERVSGKVPDSLAALAAMAGRTSRLKFGSSVLVAPAYNPVLLAKALATIDVLSGGRVLPAVGIGQDNPQELEALGVVKQERGKRLDEAIVLMKRLWTEERVTFHGAFYNVSEFTVWPRPVGPLPHAMWVGGNSDAAHRRAGRLCDGWLPSSSTPAEIQAGIAAIKAYAAEAGRRIEDDHYGALMPVSFDAEPSAQLVARRPNVHPRDYGAFGSTEAMLAQGRRFVEAGAVKLVLFPSVPEDLAQLERLRDEVALPLEALPS